jgi:hypothetical protein
MKIDKKAIKYDSTIKTPKILTDANKHINETRTQISTRNTNN